MRPWEEFGMSRATWYRHGKPTEKPKRYTQADIAKVTGVSIRTVQRDAAGMREDDRQKRIARAREYMDQGYTEDEACGLVAAELRAQFIEQCMSKDGGAVLLAGGYQYAAKMAQPRDTE